MNSDFKTAIPSNIEESAYRRVRLLGTLQNVYLRAFAGKDGYYLLQPIKTSENRYILVNRGTFSGETEKIKKEHSEQWIEGVVYCKLNSKVRWVASNDPEKNLWFWFDIPSMSKYLQIPLEKCLIWSNATAASGIIKPNRALKVRNDHLEYAITWYALAIIWSCGYVIFVRRQHT